MNRLIDGLNDYLGERPGFLPLVGIGLVFLNLLLQIFPGPGSGWFVDGNVLMHLGIILGLLGILLARAFEG